MRIENGLNMKTKWIFGQKSSKNEDLQNFLATLQRRNHIIGQNNKDTKKYIFSKLFYSIDGTVDLSGNNVENLPWTYLGQVPFLVKTGPGVDTIIKKTTNHPTPPTTNFFGATTNIFKAFSSSRSNFFMPLILPTLWLVFQSNFSFKVAKVFMFA